MVKMRVFIASTCKESTEAWSEWGVSPGMDGSPGSRGNPSGGSQQHCSAGVCACSTIFEPFC